LLKLMRLGWRRLAWDEQRQQRCLAILAAQSFDTYRHPLEVLDRNPQIRHSIVDYRDAVSDPAATLEAVYRDLGLPMTPAYRELLLAEGKRAREHVSGHAYSLAEFGLEADEIRSRLGDLFERYGWDDDGQAGEANEGAPT
jgi:hypothetical protein